MADDITVDQIPDMEIAEEGRVGEDEAGRDKSLPPPRRAWIAVLIALLSPIAGVLYAGAPRLVWPFLALQLLMAVWLVTGWAASFVGFFAYLVLMIGQGLLGMVVAGIVAHTAPQPMKLARYQRYWIYLAIIIAFGAGQRLAASINGPAVVGVDSSSMFPTLWSSDLALATGGRFTTYEPRRGDIVVYWHPKSDGERWIKRIVALPGDHLDMKDGQLVINGHAVERTPMEPYTWEPRPGLVLNFNHMREHWPKELDSEERSIDTVNIAALVGNYNNRTDYVVPDGHVFVMGDYRDNSLDSRTRLHGPLPIDNITHRVVGILWSPRRKLSLAPVYDQNFDDN
ncbi:MAG: signal peptidase I [Alphaproteobacteria bacterium]|nr:signal peptidase I [Alphaproteobacteria bacterium]MAS48925.1 signal peptidase I [Alphaproteobacteria bacterium]MAX97473.1 signal peptidase I [Alphaproteobacteria bacterium]MBN52687.1 signal peptidase I [Alphaproteobacteria bacterium]OUT39536.1 MAG: signal peptidase I [Micavibrio sp. TMED2]|tara:strand:- start:22059 stop:23081 length:1023 start_codon:yes stop_codon:yes gene_type:complete